MAEIRHLENRYDVIFFCWGWFDLDKISETGAKWHVDYGDMVKIETICRILIWRTFVRIPWHVIPEPPATFQSAATWRIQYHDPRATCRIAGCCHRANSVALSQSQGAATWWIHCHDSGATCHIAGCNNSIRHIENRFSPYFFLIF